jgi:hypothetical protein
LEGHGNAGDASLRCVNYADRDFLALVLAGGLRLRTAGDHFHLEHRFRDILTAQKGTSSEQTYEEYRENSGKSCHAASTKPLENLEHLDQ